MKVKIRILALSLAIFMTLFFAACTPPVSQTDETGGGGGQTEQK
jgi:hypothetical protein